MTTNELLGDNAQLLRKVGDLSQLRATGHIECLIHIRSAVVTLAELCIIPESTVVSCLSVLAAYDAVREMPEGLSNAEMFRRFSRVGEQNRTVKRSVVCGSWQRQSPW